MESLSQNQVALLIDFENLVRGVKDGTDTVDCQVLFKLAEEYGRVLLANAYADWRMRDLNQYQVALYRLGVELIHVLGKREGETFKNAVDVKMAVDAVRAIALLPHIDVFVIVSGDRDFIPVLKELRRHGKTVVGVSPRTSASNDFAALCDRFVYYESLASSFGPSPDPPPPDEDRMPPPDLDQVRRVLRSILSRHPDGIKGAMIKPFLRRRLSPSFDESLYGYSRLTEMLLDLEDTARVEFPERKGDILVFPAGMEGDRPQDTSLEKIPVEEWIRRAELDRYSYQFDVERRRDILRSLFEAMRERDTFTWEEIQEDLAANSPETTPETSTIQGFLSILYHVRGFSILPNQGDLPKNERAMRLRHDVETEEDFVRLFESAVAYKIKSAAGFNTYIPPPLLAGVLGLPAEDKEVLDYCRFLLSNPYN